jgi:predicted nucleic acid-binding protein
MKHGSGSAPGSKAGGKKSGVLDAGVVLVRLDRNHPSHRKARRLFDRSAQREVLLYISVVNLAEVFHHSREYTKATGLDPMALLGSFNVVVHSPDAEVARQVAALVHLEDASLADRFAAATSGVLNARLHTTDTALARALRKHRKPVTLY